MTPEIIVLSGPNGAGKSTTATVLLPERLAMGVCYF
jgi:ABC-type multidrug transport system ATPase subunit